jgi:hypothetical protein
MFLRIAIQLTLFITLASSLNSNENSDHKFVDVLFEKYTHDNESLQLDELENLMSLLGISEQAENSSKSWVF